MTTERNGGQYFDPKEHRIAQDWNNPDIVRRVEEQRYPLQRAISKIVSDTFKQYIPEDSSIYEVGAGTGYLKDLVPPQYHRDYVSTDYNINNLIEAQKRRKLTVGRAAANALPIPDSSKDCVVDMDAYDTLPNLQGAMNEVARVLKPGGKYVHFQINYPSDDIASFDHPDHVFFPSRIGESMQKSTMVGVTKDDLKKGIKYIKHPVFRNVLENFLRNPEEELVKAITHPEPKKISDLIQDLLAAMPVDKLVIPSLPDYLRTRLERTSEVAGLEIEESGFRGTSLVLPRSKSQLASPQYNEFAIENGTEVRLTNTILKLQGSTNVIERASLMVFVAKKPQIQ